MKCKVCGNRFKLIAANKYLAKKLKETIFELPIVYEAFDCPKCGCQNVVNVREPNFTVKETKNEN